MIRCFHHRHEIVISMVTVIHCFFKAIQLSGNVVHWSALMQTFTFFLIQSDRVSRDSSPLFNCSAMVEVDGQLYSSNTSFMTCTSFVMIFDLVLSLFTINITVQKCIYSLLSKIFFSYTDIVEGHFS